MDFADVVKQRRSIRAYDTEKQVSDAQLKELFSLVALSPSSYNLQPWEFIVVREKENKRRLRACAHNQQHVEDASATIIVLASLDPSGKAEAIIADRMKNRTMDNTKREQLLAAIEYFKSNPGHAKIWAIKSTSLACMTLMLAAQNMGLATCPMEGIDAEAIKKEFNIPKTHEVVMLITLGYQKGPQPPRPMRFGYEDIVRFETF
jgi:nitroreductase